MNCAWNELVSILPVRMRAEVDALGKASMQELRLRINAPPELKLQERSIWLSGPVTREELAFVINTASRYSPWAAASASQGFITAPGGHRIGMCGEAVYKNGQMEGIRDVQYLCIRTARDYPGSAKKLAGIPGSIMVLGPPGWGKTTLLRDLIRHISENDTVCVVDERSELFPAGFHRGRKMDVLSGCPKHIGIDLVLRTMGPGCIAVDEITAEKDCAALLQASNCGVRLLATAHAGSIYDYKTRKTYRMLVDNHVFETIVVLQRDKSYQVERMTA